MKRKIEGLDERIFRERLSEKLKPQAKEALSKSFKIWVGWYEDYIGETGNVGWYIIPKFYTASGNPEIIRTN